MTTRTPDTTPVRTAAATVAAGAARSRRAQDAAAAKLTALGWACFPPEKREYLEQFMRAHQDDAGCAPAGGTQG